MNVEKGTGPYLMIEYVTDKEGCVHIPLDAEKFDLLSNSNRPIWLDYDFYGIEDGSVLHWRCPNCNIRTETENT